MAGGRLRLPPRADLVGAAALLLLAVGDLVVGQEVDVGSLAGGGAVVLAILETLPLAWRRRAPHLVMTVVGTAGIVMVATGVPTSFGGVFGIMVALYSIVAHGNDADAVQSGIITLGVLVFISFQLRDVATVAEIVANYVLFGTAWALGYAARNRRLLLEELEARNLQNERRRAQEARHAVVQERTRIARELHDVVAHTVSVMVVQAGAARRLAERDPDRVHDACRAIEDTGREALGELRRLLDVLRDDTDPGDPELAPQPTLEGLPALVRTLRDAGMPVELTVEGSPAALPAAVDVSAYRIVQESLTNVLKHAGPVRNVEVRVAYSDAAVEVAVHDDGQGAAAPRRNGRGLVGMRERAALLGGEVVARPRRGGGFEVWARLPVSRVGPRLGASA